MSDDLKIRVPEWARHMYNRLVALINAGGGGGGGGEENVIEAISFNGANVPPDANKNVALVESDPTVPSWAKQSSKPTYTAQEVGALPANTTYVSGVKGMAAALEGMSVDRAAKTDLTSIIATGTTNTTGATITVGTYFYLNGTLVQALTDIASGATFTSGTNYKAVTAGGLNSLNSNIAKHGLGVTLLGSTSGTGEKTLSGNYTNYRYILLVAFSSSGLRIYPTMIPSNILINAGYRLSVISDGGANTVYFPDLNKVEIVSNQNTIRIFGIK